MDGKVVEHNAKSANPEQGKDKGKIKKRQEGQLTH